LGTTIDVPLSTESHTAFAMRVSHLPTHLYGIAELDRDKLQHFFGSAWMKHAFGMTWFARLAGSLVETGEKLFVIEGAADPRDILADEDGIRFGVIANTTGPLPGEFITRTR
jgi:hypothetical protein